MSDNNFDWFRELLDWFDDFFIDIEIIDWLIIVLSKLQNRSNLKLITADIYVLFDN